MVIVIPTNLFTVTFTATRLCVFMKESASCPEIKLFIGELALEKHPSRLFLEKVIVNTHVHGWRGFQLFFPSGALKGHFNKIM